MKKKLKLTFKTEKPTGKWKAFSHPFHYIKLNKIRIGSIDDEFPHSIRLKVIKKDINEGSCPNCEWKWITLQRVSTSVENAKQFMIDNLELITEKWNIAMEEDWKTVTKEK